MGLYAPDPPEAPDYAAANREGVYTQFELLPDQKKIEAAAKLGTKVTYTDQHGEEKTVDFSGFGDLDQMRDMLPFIGESADAMAKAQLDTQKEYGLDFIDQRLLELERSDPVGFQTRKELGDTILGELRLGSELTSDMRGQVTQAERSAQAARGNVFGSAPAAAEAMAVGDAGFRMKQQRLANAASFLSGSTPVAQFGQISGAQAGASPFNPMGVQQGIGVNPNAGAQGAQFGLSNFNNKMASWNAGNTTGLAGFGNTVAGAFANKFGGAMGETLGKGMGGAGNKWMFEP